MPRAIDPACRVLIADEFKIVSHGLRALLESAGYLVAGEAGNASEALEMARTLKPDVAVLDLAESDNTVLQAARDIQAQSPDTKTILLTTCGEGRVVFKALQAGAKGYVLKTQAADDLLRAIHEVSRGAVYISPCVAGSLVDAALGDAAEPEELLTDRERQVLQLVAEGKTTRKIAELLKISFKTAESHRNRIMRKLGIHETAGLVRYAIRQGVIQA